jgi:hypothetical protein
MTAVVGVPLAVNGQIYNCAAVLGEGRILGAVPKGFLSAKNGEDRHFASGADLSTTLVGAGCFTFPVGSELLFRAKDDTVLAVTFAQDAGAPISAVSLAAIAGAEVVVELGAENAQIGAREARCARLLASSESAVCALLRVSAGKDESVELLVCPDVKVDGTDTYLDYMKTAISHLGSRPALIVLNGDMAWTMASKADFVQRFIKPAAEISGGTYPIAFARGNMECRGPFASQVYYYVPTVTGEFYYDFNFGKYRFIELDTAEDKVDSHEAYFGLTLFEDIRAKEREW